jgi:hypothetical protein
LSEPQKKHYVCNLHGKTLKENEKELELLITSPRKTSNPASASEKTRALPALFKSH